MLGWARSECRPQVALFGVELVEAGRLVRTVQRGLFALCEAQKVIGMPLRKLIAFL